MNDRPDAIDKMVYTETTKIRKLYEEACKRRGVKPRELSPIVIMQRSVPYAHDTLIGVITDVRKTKDGIEVTGEFFADVDLPIHQRSNHELQVSSRAYE